MNRKLLFSVTKNDFVVETFRAGGPGGQNQNKRDSGVRIKHPDSGAVGECRVHRTQLQNKKEAFRKLVDSEKFKIWHRLETAKHLRNGPPIEEVVEEMMEPHNLRLDIKDENGLWKAVDINASLEND